MEVVNETENSLLNGRSRMKAREKEDGSPMVERGSGKDGPREVQETPARGGKNTGKHHVEVGGAKPREPIVEKALGNGDSSTSANQLYNMLGLTKQSNSMGMERGGEANQAKTDMPRSLSPIKLSPMRKRSCGRLYGYGSVNRSSTRYNSPSPPNDPMPSAATESKVTSILKQPHLGPPFKSTSLRQGAIRSYSGDAGGQQP